MLLRMQIVELDLPLREFTISLTNSDRLVSSTYLVVEFTLSESGACFFMCLDSHEELSEK